jgi:hypothetical protein
MSVGYPIYVRRLLRMLAFSGFCFALASLPGCSFEEMREAARRTKSANNLRELGLALYCYEENHNELPKRASRDQDGKPLLSWRVELLPYLGETELYNEFRRDEPWDSEHNIKLLEKMPEVFRYPKSEAKPGMTVYVAPYGVKTIWDLEMAKFANVADGVSNTIMITEVTDSAAVPWTKPDDFDMATGNLLEAFGLSFTGGHCAFMDGSVRFISRTIAEETFKALMTPEGGEAIDIDIP